MIKFKKIASVMASTLLIGSTVFLASAANYPQPFRDAGTAAIVWGSSAANTDLAAATNIAVGLQSVIGTPSDGGDDTPISGEAFPLFTGSTEVYLNDSINVARTALTESELPSLLADGDFSGNVNADFTQTISFPASSRVLFGQEPTGDEDPQVFVNLGTSASSVVYNASVTFDRAVNLTNTDSVGEILDLFGSEWTVGADTDTNTIVLYRSSERIPLSLGGSSPVPSTTVTVDGAEYTIELVAASDTSATIRVTDSSGQSQTREIDEDESRQVNGLEVAVAYADESDATGIVSAEVTVGSQKISLEDSQNVKVGTDEESLDGTQVSFNGGSVGALTKLTIQVYADDSDADALTSGDSFADPVWGSFKLQFNELNVPLDDTTTRESISVDNTGDDRMRLRFTNHRGDAANFEFANNESQSLRLAYGDQGREVIKVVENAALNRSMYVMVGNEDEGYLLKLDTVSNSSSDTNDDIIFKDVFDSSRSYKASITSEGVGTVTIGGKTYSVTYSGPSTDSQAVVVRLNYPDSSGNNVIVYPTIQTSKGAKVGLYEPVTINISSIDGAGTDAAGLIFPDGDDYASAATTTITEGGNFTVNGVQLTANLNSTTVSVGSLRYNVTRSGVETAQIFLIDPVTGGNYNKTGVVVFEEEEDRSDAENAMVIEVRGSGSSTDELEVSTVVSTATTPATTTGTGNSYVSLESNDDLSQMLTIYGSLVTLDDTDSNHRNAMISYPDEQVQAKLYVAELDASIGGSDGGTTSLGIVPIQDSEVSSVSSRNMIVVGGSCVNTVAARLLGSSSPVCGTDFTARTQVGSGQFLIQSFASPFASNKIAVLVAGYNAQDTENAATYLRTQSVDTTVGKKYVGTTATQATLQTS